MDHTTEKGSSRQNDGRGLQFLTVSQHHASDGIARYDKINNLAFHHLETWHRCDFSLHCGSIQISISLRPRTLHRRAFAPIQQPELNSGCIGDNSHDAVKSVDLANQVALAEPTDCGVARHHADAVGL